jgi:hypothetical protein
MEYVIFWIGFSIIIWVMANNRNRSGLGWFLLSLIISPLLSALLLLVIGKHTTEDEMKELESVKNDFIQLYCENEDFASKNPNFKRIFREVSSDSSEFKIDQIKDAINIIATEASSSKSETENPDEQLDSIDKIEKLAVLKEKGFINEHEFEDKKQKILATI